MAERRPLQTDDGCHARPTVRNLRGARPRDYCARMVRRTFEESVNIWVT
jgi:hypothetical protein